MPLFWQNWTGGTAQTASAVPVFLQWQPTPPLMQWTGTTGGTSAYTASAATTSATTVSVYGNGYVVMQNQQTMLAQQAQIAANDWGLLVANQRWDQEQIARAAILRHQEEARRDEHAYRRALGECDNQEAERIIALIDQREATAAARRHALEEQQAQAQQEVQRRQAAVARARELLLEHLNPAQRDTFTKNGWFIVEGGRTRTKYRIHTNGGVAGNIDVLGRDERVMHRLCCHARDSNIPHGDHHLSQKIMLELAEDDFLRMANRHAA